MALQTINLGIYSSCIYVLIPNSLEEKSRPAGEEGGKPLFYKQAPDSFADTLVPCLLFAKLSSVQRWLKAGQRTCNCSVSLKCQEEEQPQFSLKRPGNCILLLLASFNKHLH